MKLTVDMDTATLGEIEQFEIDAGKTWEEFADGKAGVKGTMALICLQERRTNPKFTMDDARAIKVNDIESDAADPTPPKRRAKAAS